MRIRRLRLLNWLCYEGDTELLLDARSYAVVASRQGNRDSSNWAGKSSLLEAVDFALFGRHRHRTEDAWITEGASEGFVEIELDSGDMIARSRKRGKSTVLRYYTSGREEPATKDEAQEIVLARLGLGPEDFSATCYFEQGQMGRFITSDPSERMKTVSAWFRLGPLQEAEELITDEVSKLAWSAELTSQNLKTAQEMQARALDPYQDLGALEVHMNQIAADLERARGVYARVQDEVERNQRLIAAQHQVQEYEKLVEDGTKLRMAADSVDRRVLAEDHRAASYAQDRAYEAHALAQRNAAQKKRLSLGQFDGHCPIAEMACPVVKEINASRRKNTKLSEEASAAADKAEEAYQKALSEHQRWEAKRVALEKVDEQLERTRARARELHEGYKLAKKNPVVDHEELRAKQTQAHNRIVDLQSKLESLRRSMVTVSESLSEQAKLAITLDQIERKLAVHREAKVIFGKQGAQRRVAEGALAEIEDGANEMLRECGIDLSVQTQWSREGSGLAKSCDACGSPFPSSARVKECERCHTARGPLLVNKLDLVLSDRSGAAVDLAGASLQLAASKWLRRDRESLWSVALLDEPFGQLDAANRRAFANHLITMLHGRYGFAQAFVIAHHNSILDSFPARIEITSDGKRSKARVIA